MDRYESEKTCLEKLQAAYNEYDYSRIEDALADNVTYDSFWVLSQITNKTEYMNYLKSKLTAMKDKETKIDFQIMYEAKNNRPHLVIQSPANNGVHGCYTIETENELITAIHLTPADFYKPLVSKG